MTFQTTCEGIALSLMINVAAHTDNKRDRIVREPVALLGCLPFGPREMYTMDHWMRVLVPNIWWLDLEADKSRTFGGFAGRYGPAVF